jgi:hypothetical protein
MLSIGLADIYFSRVTATPPVHAVGSRRCAFYNDDVRLNNRFVMRFAIAIIIAPPANTPSSGATPATPQRHRPPSQTERRYRPGGAVVRPDFGAAKAAKGAFRHARTSRTV